MNDTLKNVKWDDIFKNGMQTFSIAVNTDNSNGPGIHWFCIFGTNDTIEYFNSSGAKPSKEVHEWLHKIKNDANKKRKDLKIVLVHKNDLQKSETECGMFVLWYIYNRLNDVPFEYFDKDESANDEMMTALREFMFRKN